MIYNNNKFYLRALKNTSICREEDREKWLIQAILLGIKYFAATDLNKMKLNIGTIKHTHKAMAQLLILMTYLTPNQILNIFPPEKIYKRKYNLTITYQSVINMFKQIDCTKPLNDLEFVLNFLARYNNRDVYDMMTKLAILDSILSNYKIKLDAFMPLVIKRELQPLEFNYKI